MGRIVLSTKGQRHRLDTELNHYELAAIGYVTVLWARLEHTVLAKTIALAEQSGLSVPEDATSLSFKRRLRAYRTLINTAVNDNLERAKLLQLITNIGGVERSRNRITHGIWDWELADPAQLRAWSARVPYHFEEHFDFHKLIKVAHRIGELSFQLEFPGGEKEALEHQTAVMMQRGFSVSRSFALEMTGRDPQDPRRNPPRSRIRKKPGPPPRVPEAPKKRC